MFFPFNNDTRRMKQLVNIINRDGKHYFVSTNDTFDHGFETMIFPCNADGEVTDWGELFAKTYHTIDEATAGHKEACDTFQPTERYDAADY